MNISMDKKYTLRGEAFTLLTVTKPGQFPIVGYTPDGDTYELRADGSTITTRTALVEVSPYADFVIDEPVMVRDNDNQEWISRHFAGVGGEIIAFTWIGGRTSWTEKQKVSWQQCRHPTAEEFAT